MVGKRAVQSRVNGEKGEERGVENKEQRCWEKMRGKQRIRGEEWEIVSRNECRSWERGEEVEKRYVTRHGDKIIPQNKL